MLVIEHREAMQRAQRLAQELRVANEKLRDAAIRDSLTGLYNHRFFQEALEREVNRAVRHERPVALMMVDIDNFKAVNDRCGHPSGDLVLKTIAQAIIKDTRRSDLVARYGGEEFVIILPESNIGGAVRKGEAYRKVIEAIEIKIASLSIKVTVSIGVAAIDHRQIVSKEELIQAADRALYRSKHEGRNCVTAWDPSLKELVH
jgi:diguanylate cyclase (GGDEF)-like protein